MYRNILKVTLTFIFLAISFIACNSSSSANNSNSGFQVTVIDGYIKGATVTDSSGQTARDNLNGTYTFSNDPVYPIKSTGGELVDTGVSFDIDMSVDDGVSTVISPITTFLGNDSDLLSKFAGLNLGISTLDEFNVDYIKTDNINLTKLAQILYLIQKDSTLNTTFKASVKSSSSLVSLDDLFTLAKNDINNSLSSSNSHISTRMQTLLTKVQNYSGAPSEMENAIKVYKNNLVTRGESISELTHNGLEYGAIQSPYTGKYWLDRNIGATRVCTKMDDTECYGSYFQWGREVDGHEQLNSSTTDTKETTISNTSANFITATSNFGDWTTADSDRKQRAATWSKTDGSSVCPIGYRVPTEAEIKAETVDLTGNDALSNAQDVFNDFLGIPAAGYRYNVNGNLLNPGTAFSIATTTLGITDDSVKTIDADSSSVVIYENIGKNSDMQYGISVRCIKN